MTINILNNEAQLCQNLGPSVGAILKFCIYVNNKVVVDLWGYSEGFKIDGHSLNVIWSSGKSIASILMAKMVEDGNLNLDEKICTYWPEFA